MKNNKINKKAFTLVELIVVIGILVILSSLIIPRVTDARANAQRMQCAQNIKTILNSCNMYCVDLGVDITKKAKTSADVFGRLYAAFDPDAESDKDWALRDMAVYVCPQNDDKKDLKDKLLPSAWGKTLTVGTGADQTSPDYEIVSSDYTTLTMPSFKNSVDGNIFIVENLDTRHDGINAGYFNGKVEFLTTKKASEHKNIGIDKAKAAEFGQKAVLLKTMESTDIPSLYQTT